MSFEVPMLEPERIDSESNYTEEFSDIILTEQEHAEFAEVSDRIWAKILEEISL
jgi:hypothetical protein